ncbi:MAG: hypothetical protein MJE77_22115 [Proteobacteria bacterium]|nr:hypothetical protein [Pseudomonadota bacterium]
MSSDFLEERRRSLEEKFFHQENERDLQAFRDKLAKQTTRDELRKASGMQDDEVLDKLAEMGITGDTVTALSLVPLLKIAWADGKVQDNERQAILQGARGKGIEEGSPGDELLARWLSEEPDRHLFEAWAAYIKALRGELTAAQTEILRTQVIRFAKAVAEVAGGFLGIGAVSQEEKQALAWIERVFDEKLAEKKPSGPNEQAEAKVGGANDAGSADDADDAKDAKDSSDAKDSEASAADKASAKDEGSADKTGGDETVRND